MKRPRRVCMSCGKRRLMARGQGMRLCSKCFGVQCKELSRLLSDGDRWEFAVEKTDPKTCKHNECVTLWVSTEKPHVWRCEQCGTEWPRIEDMQEITIRFD